MTLEEARHNQEQARVAWRNEWSGRKRAKFSAYIKATAEVIRLEKETERSEKIDRN